MKSNKSVLKRLRLTSRGKIVARKAGQNHFNAKESRHTQMNQKRTQNIVLTNKTMRRYLTH